jgi:hypothetical protein
MTNDKRAENLRLDALGIAPPENILGAKNPTHKKQKLNIQFKGGVAHLVLSTDDKG